MTPKNYGVYLHKLIKITPYTLIFLVQSMIFILL
jgi:hypothetical protein